VVTFQIDLNFLLWVVSWWSGFWAADFSRWSLRSAQVGFRPAPLRFPLRSRSAHMFCLYYTHRYIYSLYIYRCLNGTSPPFAASSSRRVWTF